MSVNKRHEIFHVFAAFRLRQIMQPSPTMTTDAAASEARIVLDTPLGISITIRMRYYLGKAEAIRLLTGD